MFDFSSLRSLFADVTDKREEIFFADILRLTPKLDDLTCSGLIMHLFEYPSYQECLASDSGCESCQLDPEGGYT